MMSDFIKLRDIFLGFGLDIKVEEKKGGKTIEISAWSDDPKIGGYTGFHTDFDFDSEGTFLKVSMWE